MSYEVELIVEDFMDKGMPEELAGDLESLLAEKQSDIERLQKVNDEMKLKLSYVDNPE